MTTIMIKPRNKKEYTTFNKILKALNADFESVEKPHNPKLLEIIKEAKEDYANGNYRILDDNLKKELFGSL